MIFVAQRPVMLNGIGAVVERADLLDRALIVDLPIIDERRRREKREFWSAFEAARPALLGALLDAVSAALALAPHIRLAAKPRMADFAIWATAAEPGLGLGGSACMGAYASNRDSIHELALEASAVAAAVRMLADREAWKGTAAELLDTLNTIADEAAKKAKSWPPHPVAWPMPCAGWRPTSAPWAWPSPLPTRRRSASADGRSPSEREGGPSFLSFRPFRRALGAFQGTKGAFRGTMEVQPGTIRTIGTMPSPPVLVACGTP